MYHGDNDLPRCPYCGTASARILREWQYAAFLVKNYNCEKCDRHFKAYYWNGKLSHIIGKCSNTHTQIEASIMDYLKEHESAGEDEIAEALYTDVSTILEALLHLEKRGLVVSTISIKEQ